MVDNKLKLLNLIMDLLTDVEIGINCSRGLFQGCHRQNQGTEM